MLNIIEVFKIRKAKIIYTRNLRRVLHQCFSKIGNFQNQAILIDKRLIAKGFDLKKFFKIYANKNIRELNCSIKNENLFELSFDFEIKHDLAFNYYILAIYINQYTLTCDYQPYIDLDISLIPYPNSRINSNDIIINEEIIERYDLL